MTKHLWKVGSLFGLILFIHAYGCAQDFPLARRAKENRVTLTKTELKKHLLCDPVLISQAIMEKGFGSEVTVHYGSYTLTRTDVGDPDGWLTVSKEDRPLCKIELSLDPTIYLSIKNKVLILSGYSGSDAHLEAFSLSDQCVYLGYMLDTGGMDDIENLLDSHGSRTCER